MLQRLLLVVVIATAVSTKGGVMTAEDGENDTLMAQKRVHKNDYNENDDNDNNDEIQFDVDGKW